MNVRKIIQNRITDIGYDYIFDDNDQILKHKIETMDVVDIIIYLEKELNIFIPTSEVEGQTFNHLIKYINKSTRKEKFKILIDGH